MAEQEDGLTPPTKGVKKEGKAKKEAAPKEQRARRSKFAEMYPDASTITMLVEENPKKEGSKSRTRFDHYFNSKTVGEFIAAGGTYADIAYDIGRMHIQITVPKKAA